MFLVKLPGAQSLKNSLTLYGRFITVFKKARCCSLFRTRQIRSVPLHNASLNSILILSSLLAKTFYAVHFFPGFLPKPHTHFSYPHSFYMPRPFHPPRLDNSKLPVYADFTSHSSFVNCGGCSSWKRLVSRLLSFCAPELLMDWYGSTEQAMSSVALEAEMCSICLSAYVTYGLHVNLSPWLEFASEPLRPSGLRLSAK